MRRTRATEKEQANAEFLASKYSNEELAYLIDHFGESPEVAVPADEELPPGVNPAAITPILDQTFRLELLQVAARERMGDDTLQLWCGFDKLREVCQLMLDWNATVQDLKKRTRDADGPIRRAAGAPSLHMWDPDTDIPYLGGVGADSDFVRTALDGNQRVPLYVMLRETGLGAIKEMSGVAALLRNKKGKAKATAPKNILADTPNALEYDHGSTTSVVRCPICGHTEVFETSKPSTKRKAETAMRKHLETTKVKKEQHHILGQRLKSGKAGTASTAVKPETMDEMVEEAGEDADTVDE